MNWLFEHRGAVLALTAIMAVVYVLMAVRAWRRDRAAARRILGGPPPAPPKATTPTDGTVRPRDRGPRAQ